MAAEDTFEPTTLSYPFQYGRCTKCGGEFGYNIEKRQTPPDCTYPACRPPREPGLSGYRVRNAQVGEKEATAVAVHPTTGEVVYCFFNPSDPLPERYAREGFVKQQFQSLHSLRRFCNERGLVNDIEYDNRHDGYHEEQLRERERIESQRDASYRRERELARRALRDGRN